MQIETVAIDSLIPDPSNARRHDAKNLDAIKGSLAKFGQRKPIVVRNNIVLAGNGTLEAAKALGWSEITVAKADDLSSVDATAYALADNRSSELATWDAEVLNSQLKALDDIDFDLSQIGFDDVDLKEMLAREDDQEKESIYTDKIKAPIYQPTGPKPPLSDLLKREKTVELISKIDQADNVEPEVKDFLRAAAYRHFVFNYQNIAEFYAHSNKETQQLFEDSALVIIDFNSAIENGFVTMTKELAESYTESDYDA